MAAAVDLLMEQGVLAASGLAVAALPAICSGVFKGLHVQMYLLKT